MRPASELVALILVAACRTPSPAPAPAPSTANGAAPEPAADKDLDRDALRAKAHLAYVEQRWLACGEAYERLSSGPDAKPGAAYNAACCFARAAELDRAFAALTTAAALGWREVFQAELDTDLASLRADARWPEALAAIEANRVAYRSTVDARLLDLYEADQADRFVEGIDWSVVSARDRVRQAEVRERVKAGAPKVADDWFHAAMVMQHGEDEEPIERAREWALRAVELDPHHESARWLAAAAQDRLLMRRGLPQRYGTQFMYEEGRWVLYDVDPWVTDKERAQWNVPPLAEARRQAELMNEQ